MNVALFLRSLRDHRWHIFWFGLGLAIYGGVMVALYPAFSDTLTAVEYPAELLQFFGGAGDLSSADAFVTLEYNSFAPLIMVIYGVIVGTGLLAGDEGRGTLENLLAQPVHRATVFWSRAAALLAGAVLIGAVNTLGWFLTVPFVDVDPLTLGDLLLVTALTLPVVAFYGALAMLLAAVAPSRGAAAGILSAVVIASYLLNSFAEIISALEWTRTVNPYYYADAARVLIEGPVWWHQGLLVAGALVLFVLASVAFTGREVNAGIWQPRALARGLAGVR